jgi:hypothetical protein
MLPVFLSTSTMHHLACVSWSNPIDARWFACNLTAGNTGYHLLKPISHTGSGPKVPVCTPSAAGMDNQHQQQQQQQQEQQQEGGGHDPGMVLSLAFLHCRPVQKAGCAYALRPLSRQCRLSSLIGVKHLPLHRYTHAQHAAAAAVAAQSAAAPHPIPWWTLGGVCAAGGLMSLDIRQCQVPALLAGITTAAAPVLAATLAGLRCLRVADLSASDRDSPDPIASLRAVGSLVVSCSGVTKLVLGGSDGMGRGQIGTVLIEGMVAAARAAGWEHGGAGPRSTAAAASGQRWPVQLRQLRHLTLKQEIEGFLPALLGSGGAPNLTNFSVTKGSYSVEDLLNLAACSALQEINLYNCGGVMEAPVTLPQEVLYGSALTKLVVEECTVAAQPAISKATQLRSLRLPCSNPCEALLSRPFLDVMQLTLLDIMCDSCGGQVYELPHDLSSWMPQLRELDVSINHVTSIPPGLQHLTCLLLPTRSPVWLLCHTWWHCGCCSCGKTLWGHLTDSLVC